MPEPQPAVLPLSVALHTLRMRLTPDLLRLQPPERQYLLRTEDGAGALVRGKIGLFAASGGSGKSWALTQLAVAVATGGRWFGPGGWRAEPGRVLLLLGEEDREEVERRLYWAVRACHATDAELEKIAERVIPVPLAGHGVALTTGDADGAVLPETPMAEEVRNILRTYATVGKPIDLVVMDPQSRFAGGDVEKDSAAATRFVQVVETFTAQEFGSPSVLIAHHVRKPSGREDEDREVGDIIRGSSALVDGVRWAALFSQQKRHEGAPDLVRLRVVKTNYTLTPPPLTVCRFEGGNGAMRAATAEELNAYATAAGANRTGTARAKRAQGKAQILKLIAAQPDSRNGLARRAQLGKDATSAILQELGAEGAIRHVRQKWFPAQPDRTQVDLSGPPESGEVDRTGPPPPLGAESESGSGSSTPSPRPSAGHTPCEQETTP